jgi:hypothetical protein
MTGEMAWINQDGEDSSGEVWGIHAAVAKAVGGTLKPFDQYQGPYIVVGDDVTVGEPPYALAVQHLGVTRLWLCSDDGWLGYVYREDTETQSMRFAMSDESAAIEAARQVLG